MDMPTDFSGFACPQAGLAPDLLDLLVVEHADQLISTVLERHSGSLEQSAPGLCGLFKTWLARPPGADRDTTDFDTVWNAAFGDMHAMLVSQTPSDLLRSAAAVALRLNACGQPGGWEVSLPAAAALRFGPWVLPAASAISVRATTARVALCLHVQQTWRTMVFERAPGGPWTTAQASLLEALHGSGHADFAFLLAPRNALSEPAAARLLFADAYQFDGADMRITESWRGTCAQALTLLNTTAPHYAAWVSRVLRELVPLKARPAVFNSGSEQYSPGVVCVCDHPYRWPLAEMLVHECSHQYLHIINRLGPLDDGSDTGLHYSPFRNKPRPLFFIVVAYHAFANVLLFYRHARARGLLPDPSVPSDAFTQRERVLQAQLRQIEPVLLQSRALTPLGRALWEPLYQALQRETARA
jgi:HEXXH motif-containing protein